MNRKTLEQYKHESPEIPTHTCPYIDFIESIIKEIKDENDSFFIEQKLIVIESILEYVRASNDSLRSSGNYWYKKFNTLYNKK